MNQAVEQNTVNLSNKLNGTVAVTGATGFIGQQLLKQLSHSGWKVKALYRPQKNRKIPTLEGLNWIPGSLQDKDSLQQLTHGCDAIIHCAGAVRGASQEDFDQVNVEGTRNLVEVVQSLKNPPKFLLLSSLAARSPELSFYAGSKARGESVLKNASDILNWTIFRPPAVYGPGDKELMPLFESIKKGFAPVPSGSESRFSMIYVKDLTAAMIKWLEADRGFGKTFELDDGVENGYDWDAILETGGEVLRNGRKVFQIQLPLFVLKLVASINLMFANLFGYAPMLTPGKVREITHTNWVSNGHELTQNIGWKPEYNLKRGLSCLFGQNLSTQREH